MAEKLSREESARQRRELQQLMMEAYAAVSWPEVGLLVETDEPVLLYNYLHAVKQEDPALTKMVIGLSSEGVVIYHGQARADAGGTNVPPANVGVENEQKDGDASNGEAYSDL